MTKKHVNTMIFLSISHTTPGNDVKKIIFLKLILIIGGEEKSNRFIARLTSTRHCNCDLVTPVPESPSPILFL